MFNAKEMRLITDHKKAKKYFLRGRTVYMVQKDGSLVELTKDTDWKVLFFHIVKQGKFAVYKRRFAVERTMKGGGVSWMFASYREEI